MRNRCEGVFFAQYLNICQLPSVGSLLDIALEKAAFTFKGQSSFATRFCTVPARHRVKKVKDKHRKG